MISVIIISKVTNMVGMLGTSSSNVGLLSRLVARDGISIVDADEMCIQWQARITEGMLFHEIRSGLIFLCSVIVYYLLIIQWQNDACCRFLVKTYYHRPTKKKANEYLSN
jgi:hypothetical protein